MNIIGDNYRNRFYTITKITEKLGGNINKKKKVILSKLLEEVQELHDDMKTQLVVFNCNNKMGNIIFIRSTMDVNEIFYISKTGTELNKHEAYDQQQDKHIEMIKLGNDTGVNDIEEEITKSEANGNGDSDDTKLYEFVQ